MRHPRLLVSISLATLAALSIGATTAWLSDSTAVTYEITAAAEFGDEPEEKVWVCKVVGPPHDLKVKKGENPIHVSVDSIHAEEGFSDAHPSYVVDDGEVECSVPEEPAMDRGSRDEEQVEPPSPSTTTSTSTTSTSSTSTSSTSTTSTSSTSTTSTTTSTSTTTTTSISTTTTTATNPPDN